MNEKNLSEEQYTDARAALTLPLSAGPSPFELSDEEHKFRPDDWAWLFLRLSQEYSDGYYKHENDRDLELTSEFVEPQILGLKADSDGDCASEFGLSIWVPPLTPKLPSLINSTDSWFFPLMRFITEAPRSENVRSSQNQSPRASYAPKVEKPPHIRINEATFGYRPATNLLLPRIFGGTPTTPLDRRHNISSWSNLWVAIDCSIPPAGQIAALEALAKMTYHRLTEDGNWAQHNGYWDCAVEEISLNDVFLDTEFSRASAATSQVTDFSSVWRAVVIDPLGAIKTQRDRLLQTLQKIHYDLLANGFANEPRFQRFQNTLPTCQDNDRTSRNGGSYLKALLTLAELYFDQRCTDPQKIAQIVGVHSASGRYSYNWIRDFHSNIEQYIDDAQQMVNGGYRRLIYMQKPNI